MELRIENRESQFPKGRDSQISILIFLYISHIFSYSLLAEEMGFESVAWDSTAVTAEAMRVQLRITSQPSDVFRQSDPRELLSERLRDVLAIRRQQT